MAKVPQSFSTHSAALDTPIATETAARALRDGPIGAYVVAGVAVALLLLGWLAFYFLVFLPRGAIG